MENKKSNKPAYFRFTEFFSYIIIMILIFQVIDFGKTLFSDPASYEIRYEAPLGDAAESSSDCTGMVRISVILISTDMISRTRTATQI